jgi:hypothetical protein
MIQITALDVNNEPIKVARIFDINGSGSTIRVDFENKRPQIQHVDIRFQQACSGSLEIKSWRPL